MTLDDKHKLARPLLAGFSVLVAAVVVVLEPATPIEMVLVIVSPAVTYIGLKWTGYNPGAQPKNPL